MLSDALVEIGGGGECSTQVLLLGYVSVELGSFDNTLFCRPCELDAYVFGHLYTLQTTSLPEEADVQGIISKFPNLENYLRRLERKIFLR